MIFSRVIRDSHRDEGSVDIVVSDGVITGIFPAGQVPHGDHVVMDCDDRLVIPGLWDEHVHFSFWAQHRRRISLASASSAAEAVAIMAQAVEDNAASQLPAPIVIGAEYRDGLWPDEKLLHLLDSATGDTPVALASVDVHSGWLNSAALSALAVTGHDEQGVIKELAWFELTQRLGMVSAETVDSWVLDAAGHAASRGVVGIVDFEMGYSIPDWVRRAAGHDGPYPLQIQAAVYPDDLDRALEEGMVSGVVLAPGITVGPFKIITDGSLNSRTAHCVEPYLSVPGEEYGAMNFPPEDIEAMLTKAHTAGFWLAVHAIGDQANRVILDIFERHGLSGRIEHAQLVREEDFPRFAALGIIASVQPEHAIDDRDVTDVYWADRAERAFALRKLVDSDATLALGSDAPVSPLDPWIEIAAAVTRTRDGREPWQPEGGLSFDEALRFSTRTTLEVGQPANIVALDADPRWLLEAFGSNMPKASDALRGMTVALTVSAGIVTHTTLAGEGMTGIEPAPSVWKTEALPLSYIPEGLGAP